MRWSSTRARAITAMLLALMLALSGCGRYARRGAVASSAPPQDYGSTSDLPKDLRSVSPASKTTGTIVVTVTDDRNRVLPGAIVNVKGAKNLSRATDARGRATFAVPPGSYKVDVAPCGTTVVTTSYGVGTAVVGRGQTAQARLDGIQWHLRFRPEGSVTMTRRPPWPRGTDITLGVRIADGCDVSRVARGASISSYRWSASSNFTIVRAATKANAKGIAEITVRCRAAGDGSIALAHRTDRDDRVDLLLASSAPPEGKSWCA